MQTNIPNSIKDLLNKTFFNISVENFLIALSIILFFYFLRTPLSRIVMGFLKKLTKRTSTTADDKIINALEEPFKFSFIVLGFFFAKEWLDVKSYETMLNSIIKSLSVFTIFWIFYRLIHEFNSIFAIFSSRLGRPLNEDIENFIIKFSKVLIVVLGILMFLQSWGVNVTAFIASLGLGGLAFALAAKDTAANLFGSLVIFADRPFKIGDWVEVDGVEGTVEEIGIRSTRIRTFPQSQATIPNATVANSIVTNWTRMGKRRSQGILGLTYNTSSTQIEAILKDMRATIENNEKLHEDGIVLVFESFGDSALNIKYRYFTKTTNYNEFLEIVQKMNIDFMHIIEKHGSSFAFPSQSLYIENLPQNNQIQKQAVS